MSERRNYWVSAGMAFANPVEGGVHCREVWTDDKLETENERLRALLQSDWNKALFQNNKLLDGKERMLGLLRECHQWLQDDCIDKFIENRVEELMGKIEKELKIDS